MPESNLLQKLKAVFGRAAANSSFRGVAMIGSGAAVGQIILVAATPIISRLYGPHAYGGLAVFSSILSIASIIVTFRYEVNIPLPADEVEGRDLLVLALTLAVAFAGAAFVGLMAWQYLSPAASREPLIRHLVWTLPLGMVCIGCYQTLAYWATRKRLYGAISATRVNQQIASVATQFTLFRLPPEGLGLILAYIVGQAFGLRPLFKGFRKTGPAAALPSPARLVALARKYFSISAYGTATAVATNIGDSLPSLLLAHAYGLATAGIYLMASRVFALPAQMVGAAVAQVFMGEASQRLREDPRSVVTYFRSVHRNLLWVGAAIVGLGALSPLALPWILGARWHEAGIFAAILAPMAATDITVRPLYNITVIGNRPKLQLYTGLLPMGLSMVGLGVPVLLGLPVRVSLVAYALCRCLGWWLCYFIYLGVARHIGTHSGDPGDAAEQQ